MYTIKVVKDSIPKEKAREDAIWTKIFARPLSYCIASICLNLGLSANTVSVYDKENKV